MKLFISASFFLSSTVFAEHVGYDGVYDNKSRPLSDVACSDGDHGLMQLGYSAFGDLPDFPYIGGAADIGDWDSAECGTCWELTYCGKSINVLAIDRTDVGFNIAREAMDDLTRGQAVLDGVVDAAAKRISESRCGL